MIGGVDGIDVIAVEANGAEVIVDRGIDADGKVVDDDDTVDETNDEEEDEDNDDG